MRKAKATDADLESRMRQGRTSGPMLGRVGALCVAMAALVPGMLLPGAGGAQTAADITPETLAPQPPRLAGAVRFTGAPGLATPEGADRLSVSIRSVTVEGGLPDLAPAEEALTAQLTDGPVRVSDIFAAARRLEAAYARAGYVLARVVLPPQELRDGGSLRLTVVDGFIEAVETDRVPDPVRARVDAVTAPLEDRRGLRLSQIERSLLLAGDTFGLALESALARGEAPGATRLVLGGEFRPVTGFVGLDTGYGRDLGHYILDTGLEVNSLLGLGETIYFRFGGNLSSRGAAEGLFSSTPRVRTLAAGTVVPLGTQGLTLNAEIADSRTTPRTDGLPTTSQFSRGSLRLAYPVLRSRALTLVARGSLDATTDRSTAILADGSRPRLSRDRMRVLRLGGDLLRVPEAGGFDELTGVLSLGLDALGARSGSAELPLSRDGARPDFTSLSLSGRSIRPLGDGLVLALSGRAQTAFGRPLVESEQISLSGTAGLSGFVPGQVKGDSGALVRAEMRRPVEMQEPAMPGLVTPYGFVATGVVWLHQPSAVERGRERASSFGLGVELLPSFEERFTQASIRVEAARGLRHGGGDNDNRVSLVGSLRF